VGREPIYGGSRADLWWVASRFMVGREKFMKCEFFNYIKIKNHRKWESKKQNKIIKRENNKAHNKIGKG
jgi:hypothetical protein